MGMLANNFFIKAFSSRVGSPSSKRIVGAIICLAGLVMAFIELRHKYDLAVRALLFLQKGGEAGTEQEVLLLAPYNVEETLILGVIGFGCSLIGVSLMEKPTKTEQI